MNREYEAMQHHASTLEHMKQGAPLYEQACKDLLVLLKKNGRHEQLEQLVKAGPVWDGEVISKTYRDDLLQLKLAVRVCMQGEQGYTAATYRGWNVLYAEGKSA